MAEVVTVLTEGPTVVGVEVTANVGRSLSCCTVEEDFVVVAEIGEVTVTLVSKVLPPPSPLPEIEKKPIRDFTSCWVKSQHIFRLRDAFYHHAFPCWIKADVISKKVLLVRY